MMPIDIRLLREEIQVALQRTAYLRRMIDVGSAEVQVSENPDRRAITIRINADLQPGI